MKNTQRNQYFVKLKNYDEAKNFIAYLEENGFNNCHQIQFNNPKIRVIVVDLQDLIFFAPNVTCLAAASSMGMKCISVDEFKDVADLNEELTI